MRVSTRKDDPGYRNLTGAFDVYLDGALQKGVLTADEEEGLVVCLVFDGEGRVQLDGWRAKTVERMGAVVVVRAK